MNIKRLQWPLVTISILQMMVSVAYGQVAPQENQEVRAAVKARLEILQNLSAKYELRTFYPPPKAALAPRQLPSPSELPPGARVATAVTSRDNSISEEAFSRLGGLVFWESALTKETLIARLSNPNRDVDIVRRGVVAGADTMETLSETPRGGPLGVIRARTERDVFSASLVEWALGIGLYESVRTRWIKPGDLSAAEVIIQDADKVLLRYSTPDNPLIHEWTLSRQLGFAPVTYHAHAPIDEIGTFMEISCDGFENVGGLMLPMSIVERHVVSHNGIAEERKRQVVAIHEYLVQDIDNTPQRYRMRWPAGAYVSDKRLGTSFRVTARGLPATNRVGP